MVKLPDLMNWATTRDDLHRAAQVVGAIRKILVPPQQNALHLSLRVTPHGLTTESLPDGGQIWLDFGTGEVDFYHPGDDSTSRHMLNEHNPRTLLLALMSEMQTVRNASGAITQIDDFKPFQVDLEQGRCYAQALHTMAGGITQFRDGLQTGTRTPLVVWPHHFDLSFLWFPGDEADENEQPHMNFGFAPFSEGFDGPYLYAYVWPSPEDLTARSLPAPARWHDNGWTGAVVEYADLQALDDPVDGVFALCQGIHETLDSVLG